MPPAIGDLDSVLERVPQPAIPSAPRHAARRSSGLDLLAARVVDEHRKAEGTQARDCQVRQAVAIEGGRGHGCVTAEVSEVDCSAEGAIALARQHRDIAESFTGEIGAVSKVRYRQVRHPIGIEVAHGNGTRRLASSEELPRLESAIALA